jgi:tetratricopeptide (TPR) repeat protein
MNNARFLMLLLCGLLFTTAAGAQISDSLYKALPDSLRPKNKAMLTQEEKIKMLQDVDHAVVSYNYAEFHAIAISMEKEMVTSPSQRTKVYYALAIASFYINALDYDKAFVYYQKTLEHARDDTAYNLPTAQAMVYLGGLYALKLKQDSAFYFLQKGLGLAGNHFSYALGSAAYNAYLLIYEKLDLWDKAISYANKCLALMTPKMTWNEDYTIITCEKLNLFNRLYIETRQKEYADSAIAIAGKIMAAKKKDAGLWYATCYYNLAGVYFASGQYQAAKAYYDSCLMPQYITHNVFDNLMYQDKLDRAICMVKLGDAEGARILETMQLPQKDFQSLRWQNQTLYEYARSHGNWKEALQYHEKYMQYTDSVGVIRQRGQVFEAEQKYQ